MALSCEYVTHLSTSRQFPYSRAIEYTKHYVEDFTLQAFFSCRSNKLIIKGRDIYKKKKKDEQWENKQRVCPEP